MSGKGVRIEFIKEHLTFTGDDSPISKLMLSVMGAVHEFERSLIKERQLEGIALAKKRGAFKGRKKWPRSRDRPLYLLVTSAIGGRLHIKPFKINILIFFNILSYMIINH